MQKMSRTIAMAVALVMLMGALAGCSAVNNNPVVATVGDEEITYSAFSNTLDTIKQYYDYGAYQVEDTQNPLPELRQKAFEQLVDATIPVAIAHQRGMTLTAEEEKELETSFEQQLKTAISENTTDLNADATDEQKLTYFKRLLKQNGTTYDKYIEQLKAGMRDEMLAQNLREEVESTAVADEAVMQNWYDEELKIEKENYDKDPASYYDTLQYYAYFTGVEPIYRPAGFDYIKFIFVSKPAEGETKDLTAIASEIQKKLDGGEELEAFMADYNEDATADANPDGYLFASTVQDSVVSNYGQAFYDAALALKSGETSKAVMDDGYGLYFIKKLGAAPTETKTFEELKEQIYNYTLNTAKDEAYTAALEEWRGTLKIETHPERVDTTGLNQ